MPKLDKQTTFTPAPLPVAKLDSNEQLSCLRLIRSTNVGPTTFRELINLYGGAAKALSALPHISQRASRGKPFRVCPKDDAERELENARKCGAEPIFTIEPGYPALLAQLEVPPPMVYIKGRAELLNRPSFAIVGSRESSAVGLKLARDFAREIAQTGYVIVSGLARGIDGAAHEAALQTGTIAVLAGGVDVVYPPEHENLHARIASEGCLVTEQPPGYRPRGADFPRRNRIISGMSLGVLIVEAAARSGTLVTARYAAEQNRWVFAVPGHPLDPRAEGTNNLIKNHGATLVTNARDVIEALSPISGLSETAPMPEVPPLFFAAPPFDPASIDEATLTKVAEVLGPQPAGIDVVITATGLAPRVVQIALLELELAGRICRPGTGLVALRVD